MRVPPSSSVSGGTRGSPNTNHTMSLRSSGSFRGEELVPPTEGGGGNVEVAPLNGGSLFTLPFLFFYLVPYGSSRDK